jgi:hypothetical protein
MEEKPNPGSDVAVKQGCTCPVLDNNRGKGFMINGTRMFWYSYNCPVHFPNVDEEENLQGMLSLSDAQHLLLYFNSRKETE